MKTIVEENLFRPLFKELAHELNSIRTVLQLWDTEIPLLVKRSIDRRIRNQERIIRLMKRDMKYRS